MAIATKTAHWHQLFIDKEFPCIFYVVARFSPRNYLINDRECVQTAAQKPKQKRKPDVVADAFNSTVSSSHMLRIIMVNCFLLFSHLFLLCVVYFQRWNSGKMK